MTVDSLLPGRVRQQDLLRTLAAVLDEGGAAPFVSNRLVEPYAAFFPEAEGEPQDAVASMHRRLFALAGVPDDAPALGFRSAPAPAVRFGDQVRLDLGALATVTDGETSTDSLLLGPVARRAARAWRRRQGVADTDPVAESRRVDATAVCLGFGTLLANDELAVRGLDGELDPALTDPSTAWRQRPTSPLLDLGLGPRRRGLTALELVFLVAAQIVVRGPTAWSRRHWGYVWRVRCLDRALRPVLVEAVRTLSTPRFSLATQLGVRPAGVPRRRKMGTDWDGNLEFLDFDALLGVQRRSLPRRGLLGRVSPDVQLRCSHPLCRTPLPAWSPRCHGCGRAVKGERPLRAPR